MFRNTVIVTLDCLTGQVASSCAQPALVARVGDALEMRFEGEKGWYTGIVSSTAPASKTMTLEFK